MTDSSLSKLQAAQFDYEYFGRDIPEIAAKYQFDESLLYEYAEEHWQRKLPVISNPDTPPISLAEFAEELQEYAEQRLLVTDLVAHLDNISKIHTLERALLDKAIECTQAIDTEDSRAALQLKQLESIITSIRKRTPLASMYKNDDNSDTGSKVVVQILNNNNG